MKCRISRRLLCGLVVLRLALLFEVPAGAEPIALHPENGHYFIWRGRPTILVTSGEHYGAVVNLDFDYERYLATLAADGLNHTRVFSGTYREPPGAFGITDSTLAPLPGRFICPWARSDEPGPTAGEYKFDLRRWDDAYFARLRQFLAAAEQHGIVVEYTLFCPMYKDEIWAASPLNLRNNVNGIGNCPRDEPLSLRNPELVEVQEAFVRKVVRELNAFDNLYYEVCNEPYHAGAPDAWERRIVDVISSVENELPKRHLISLNVANGRKQVEDPDPRVSIFNFHYCVPPDVVGLNYGLNKVIGENETGFRGKDDYLYRNEAWNFLLAGGALYNNLDYSFTASHPGGDFLGYQSPGGGSPALRKQLGILKRFLEGFTFERMKPDARIVRDLPTGLAAQVLSERALAYAIYVNATLPPKPKQLESHFRKRSKANFTIDLPVGRYQAEWVDPLNGDVVESKVLVSSGIPQQIQTPKFSNDIALRVIARRDDSLNADQHLR